MSTVPRYTHDCDHCTFLGTWFGKEHEGDKYFHYYDLYAHHSSQAGNTIIARFGDDGPDYTSGLCFKNLNKALGEAYARAIKQGIEFDK